MKEVFRGSFTQQEPIPDEGIAAAVALMRSGRLHRYNLDPGETGKVAALEAEVAAFTGARYALAAASGGYAVSIALRAAGVGPGTRVLTNAFTLAPVPGAVAALGAEPVFVGVSNVLTIDLEELEAKVDAAPVLLLSHMRGHICDMDRLMAICDAAGVVVVEDCAHTLGADWRGTPSGRHGLMGCYSTQTYKHINSGEGGLLVTGDAETAARLTLLSGCYGFHDRHGTPPPESEVARLSAEISNLSGRMDAVRAAMLRPQLRRLPERRAAWADRYRIVEDGLRGTPGLTLVERPEGEGFVGSSFQFLVLDWDLRRVLDVVEGCASRGVRLAWFGAEAPQGYTSTYRHWAFAPSVPMPRTDRVLAGLLDMRLPLTFSLDDCAMIARIIREEVEAAKA